MKIRYPLKMLAERLPESVGRAASYVPFSVRLGRKYSAAQAELDRVLWMSEEERRAYTFARVRRIAIHAFERNSFYRDFYNKHDFDPHTVKGFEDIEQIPVVRKSDLSSVPIEKRSSISPGTMLLNTGGTSGETLSFYVDSAAFAREWAHMLHIWGRLGYRQTDTRLTFRGRNFGAAPVRFNAVHNEFLVNAYAEPSRIVNALRDILRRKDIRYLHGYPSAIFDFAKSISEDAEDVAQILRRTLRGVLFGSEFPLPQYRTFIENALCTRTLSWYGHSEMAALAYEEHTKFVYVPFLSYGYVEPVSSKSEGKRLVATSYANTASPFIRYDTGDLVDDPTYEGGLLASFKISSGRVGDFVLDRNGHRISATALIFGRHHRIFEQARFLQVRQQQPGKATFIVTASTNIGLSDAELLNLVDTSNVAMEFDFEVRREPIKTPAGKVPLVCP
jgi:phenylacetate-CoA ligase